MDSVSEKINSLLYGLNQDMLKKADLVREMMEFEEKHTRNLSSWVRAGALTGYDHLYLKDG